MARGIDIKGSGIKVGVGPSAERQPEVVSNRLAADLSSVVLPPANLDRLHQDLLLREKSDVVNGLSPASGGLGEAFARLSRGLAALKSGSE